MAGSKRRGSTGGDTSLSRLFSGDALAAVLRVLEDCGGELTPAQIKAALRDRGVPPERLAGWPGVRARLAGHEHVRMRGDQHHRTYEYLKPPIGLSPAQALSLLAGHRLPAARRAELAEVVGTALSTVDSNDVGAAIDSAAIDSAGIDGAGVEGARVEQREKDAVQALAQLAIEVEELATNGASARALIHTVRALTKLADLRPIERAGETTRFDRSRHASVGGPIADGTSVVVVRPGYTWNRPEGELLIARAVVQDRSTR